MQRLLWSAALVSIASFVPCLGWADDQQVSQQIADSLRGRLKNYSVGVRAQDGTVWLNGSVANQGQMAAAIDTAQKTPGVERVVNNLTIGRPAASTQADNRSNLRQPVVQASLELPDHAQQQLSMGGGPTAESDDQPAQSNMNRMPPAQEQGQRNSGYYADPSAANSAAANAGYAQPNMQARQAPPGMMRPMGQQAPLPLAMNSGPYRPAAMQNGGQGGGPGEMIAPPQPMQSAGPMGPAPPAPAHFDHPQMPGYAWPSYACLPELCSGDVPETVFADGLAVHRSVLPVPTSAARLAQGYVGMGRWLVVP